MAMTAMVTGAGGALGSAVTAELARAGWSIVGVDRDEAALSRLPDDVRREAADLTDAAAVDALFAKLAADGVTLGAVVHTVGMFRGGAVADSSSEDYRLLMSVNLDTAWWVSRAAAQHLAAAGGGAIVEVAARHGIEPVAGAAAYSLTKAALVHLVRVLDVELRSAGVRVNAVVPALIDTAANREVMSEKAMARAVTPGAIARVVAFLVSDDASPVVGAIVPVYGAG
jgi:NAD(P)-dependent dehydrogenase (short-subunit alcohol dehydrogenase family)